jgi:hypothetical protein
MGYHRQPHPLLELHTAICNILHPNHPPQAMGVVVLNLTTDWSQLLQLLAAQDNSQKKVGENVGVNNRNVTILEVQGKPTRTNGLDVYFR